MSSELRKHRRELAVAFGGASWACLAGAGYVRALGAVHGQIADGVPGGADGVYNRSLSRIVTERTWSGRCRGRLRWLTRLSWLSDAVQVNLMQDAR